MNLYTFIGIVAYKLIRFSDDHMFEEKQVAYAHFSIIVYTWFLISSRVTSSELYDVAFYWKTLLLILRRFLCDGDSCSLNSIIALYISFYYNDRWQISSTSGFSVWIMFSGKMCEISTNSSQRVTQFSLIFFLSLYCLPLCCWLLICQLAIRTCFKRKQ